MSTGAMVSLCIAAAAWGALVAAAAGEHVPVVTAVWKYLRAPVDALAGLAATWLDRRVDR